MYPKYHVVWRISYKINPHSNSGYFSEVLVPINDDSVGRRRVSEDPPREGRM